MPSRFRIPEATISGPYGALLKRVTRRMWGQVPDNAYVLWHNRRVMRSVLSFEQRVRRWDALDRHLSTYATLASAGVIGCSWCLDFGYFMAHHDDLDLEKVREVPRWRDSTAFSPLERDVMAYAEAMSVTPPTVDDELVARLLDALGAPAVVELTQLVALENMRSRFNSAAGLESQGYAEACALPLAAPSPSSSRATSVASTS